MDPTFLCPSSFFKYDNMELLLILLDINRQTQNPVVPPSKYMEEMTLNTEERLDRLKSMLRKERVRAEKTLNSLKAIPDIVVFQKYSVGDTLTVPVNILNTYEVSKPLRIILEPSTVFSLTHPPGIVASKIAPGIAYQVNVNFNAQEQKDYRHYFTVVTEGEKFVVPIICISDRPLLDLPDKITLPMIPVKTVTERTILVRNLGNVVALYNMRCTTGFSVHPTKGSILPSKSIQLTIRFKADVVGQHQGRLVISYETREKLTIALETYTYESDIHLEVKQLGLMDTFLNLERSGTVKLHNKSNHIARFSWKLYKDAETSKKKMLKCQEGFKRIKDLESKKFADVVHGNIVAGGGDHDVIYQRIYQDELREYEDNDPFEYTNPNWTIYPMNGDVWPDNHASFIITFIPTEATNYETTLYLEISGRVERLVLQLYGRGTGPDMDLNVYELSANDIFLCSKHQYEVSVRNKGHIPGHIEFIPKQLTFGGTMSCRPTCRYLEPRSYASFVILFSSKVHGKFIEEIEFAIKESGESKKIIFRGNIVCPLLNFDVAEVNLGKVTLGYPTSTYVNLINTTQVPIEYVAHCRDDGLVPALSCNDYANQYPKPVIISPKELSLEPETFTVLPNFASKGKLTVLPNVQGAFTKNLVIVMWGNPKYSITLPVRYQCELPDIVCETQDIFMRGCFVNYIYTKSIIIRNRNEHAGYFDFLPCDFDEVQEIVFKPKISEDFIEAYETKELELDIYTQNIGQSTLKVYIAIFGGPQKLYLCTIRCNGQGPVITVPEVLLFDEIRTLKTAVRHLKIINDSPVPAAISVTHNKNSCCTLSENYLILNPTESKELEVKVYVRYSGQFCDKLVFTTEQGEAQICNVRITASGSCILCEPALEPEIALGIILTHQTFSLNVKFTNMSRKIHKIIWSRMKSLKSFRVDSSEYIGSVFSIKPSNFDLAPGQSINCLLSGYTKTIGLIEEDFYCHAIVEGKRDFKVITSFLVIAEFVEPMLLMSHKALNFRIDTGADETISLLLDTMTITNISKLAVTANISIEEPFYLMQNDTKSNTFERHMENEDVFKFNVGFVPQLEPQECRICRKDLIFTYQGHPHKDKIPVKGEENFPNLQLCPHNIDFQCLPNYFSTSVEIIVKNVSPLAVSYQWEWLRDSLEVKDLDVTPINWPTYLSEETIELSTISEPTFTFDTNFEDVVTELMASKDDIIYKRYELDVPYPPMMTVETIDVQPVEQAIISKIERAPRYQDQLQVLLYQLVSCYEDDQSELEALRCLPVENEKCNICCDIFDLIPTYGYLGPYEAQMISLDINPPPNTSIRAVAHCHIEGGKAEVLHVAGRSSDLSFSVDNDVIEFGRQLFCEICERKILIKNTGHAPLDIQLTERQKLQNMSDLILPDAMQYNVDLIRINTDYEVQVKLFPGITREFTQRFSLQIGYLEPYDLTIHGFGGLAQIFCALPRPSLYEEDVNYLSYRAIGGLTSSFLKEVMFLTENDIKWKEDIRYNVREVLKEEEWVIIFYNDLYPTVADIQMAIERCLVDDYMSKHYQNLAEHTVKKTSLTVCSKLTAPSYLVDFEHVIRDTEAYYTVTILNYGPVPLGLRTKWGRKSALKYGFYSKLICSQLEVGGACELCIMFNPTSKIFPTINSNIQEIIYIVVPHGQKVPIEIRAHVTVPEVTPLDKCVNFNQVNLGNCLKKDLLLKNTGYVTCNWQIRIETEYRNPFKSIFYSKTTSGTLEVGEETLLNVYFEPTVAGKFKGNLIISVEQNPEEMQVEIRGHGVKPQLKISETRLKFPSILPYTENVAINFTIENISTFPIEFLFSDFDQQVDTEEQMLDILMDYYKMNRLYLPKREAGDGLPSQVLNFYQGLIKCLREKMVNESERSSVASGLDEENKLALKKKLNAQTSPIRKLSPSHSARDPLNSKTPEEIYGLLKDQLHIVKEHVSSNNSSYMMDPVGDAINNITRKLTPIDPKDAKTGILIIFYGTPHTGYTQAANKAGLRLNLPVSSVDRLILDALIHPASLASMKVRQILEETFSSVASDTDLKNPPDFDEYDQLQRKIDVIMSGKKKKPLKMSSSKALKKEKKGASKKSSKSGSSKTEKSKKPKKDKKEKKGRNKSESSISSKGSKDTGKAKVDKRPTLIGISEDLLFEIIQSQLEQYCLGLIIESLDSVFVKRPMMLLNFLLKGVGNIRYIHCILFSYTYHDYLTQKEVSKITGDENVREERRNTVEKIMDMDAISYANISAEDRFLFREDVLIPRKINSQRKKEALKRRIGSKNVLHERKGKRKHSSKHEVHAKHPPKTEETTEKKKKKSKSSSEKSSKSKSGSKKSKDSKASKDSKKDKKKKEKEKLSPEEQEIKKMLTNSENTVCEILHTLEYWDRRNGFLTKPISEGLTNRSTASKKSKSSKSSASSKKSSEKKKEPKTESLEEVVIKVYSPEEQEKITYIGIPCWLIGNALKVRNKTIVETVAEYLKSTSELLEAQIEIQTSLKPKLQETDVSLSIVQRPRKKRVKCKSEIFNLMDFEVLPQKDFLKTSFLSDEIPSVPRSASVKSKKSSIKSKSKISSLSVDKSSVNTRTSRSSKGRSQLSEAIQSFTARAVINPGDKYTYTATFAPKAIGKYNHTFTVELMGCTTKYSIDCEGICEIPSFITEPSRIFPKIAESREKSNYENCLYFIDDRVFDFGTILLPSIKNSQNKYLERRSKLNFINNSSQVCDTQLFLAEEPSSAGVFSLQPNTFTVAPRGKEEVEIRSSPTQTGNYSANLLVLIENNPKVYTICLNCTSMEADVCFEPNCVEFEHTVLNDTVTKAVHVRNLSPVMIRWRADEAEEVLSHFKICPLYGCVQPLAKQTIEFKFSTSISKDVPKKTLAIVVYDGDKTNTIPLCVECITVCAEVLNIDIDCPKDLNFGEVKGRMKHIYELPVLSKIKYNMNILFTEVESRNKCNEERFIRRLFQASPKQMALKCQKVSYANIIFFPKRNVDFINIPIFKCIVSDPVTNNVVTTFDITATATTHFARYKLCPLNEVDFGHQLVGCEKTEAIFLENSGKFDFNYVVLSLKKYQDKKKQRKAGSGGKKGKKGQKGKKSKSSSGKSKSASKKSTGTSSKSKNTKSTKSSGKGNSKKSKNQKNLTDKRPKSKPTKLDIGCFTIISSTGTLQPSESVLINITAKPKNVGLFQETVLFFISECEPAVRKGIPVILSANGVVPSFSFNNIREIFNEQYVVNTLADFSCPEQFNTSHVFVIEENALYFNKVCINTTSQTRIKIQNTCTITTDLFASLDEGAIFSLHPNMCSVEPFGYVYFTITFKPITIEIYKSILKLSFKDPINRSSNEFAINISGEGHVPEITLIEPEIDPLDRSYYLPFTPLLIGQTDEKFVTFENASSIPCKVIAEICYDTYNVLSLLYEDNKVAKINLNKNDAESQISRHHSLINLDINARVSLRIVFKPNAGISSSAFLKLHVVNNPFELYSIIIKIESFTDDIILSGLQTLPLQSATKSSQTVISRYELDFGFCPLNSFKNKRFTIKNKSAECIYKFKFTNYDKLVFSPTIGHLKPGACKEILVTFLAKSSINLVKEILLCAICKIEYLKPEIEPLSWDDRQNVVIWKEISEISLIDQRSSSAPLSSRRRESSSIKLKRKSVDDTSSVKQSKTKLKMSSKRSMSSLKLSDNETMKSDRSVSSVKEKKIESKPEPPFTQLVETAKCIEFVISITSDYCTYVCETTEILMEDTLMFEKRSTTFQVLNTSTMPLVIDWVMCMNECFPRRINSMNDNLEVPSIMPPTDPPANTIKSRLVKSARQRPVHLTGNENFLPDNCTPPRIKSSSTMFSDGSVTSRSRDSWHESDYMPFTVEPRTFTIRPSGTKDFTITFSPIDVFQYVIHLYSYLPNLKPNTAPLEILIHAKSLLPLYHFDIIPTDYLTVRRQGRKLCGDLVDENTKVVEFDAIGLNMQHTRKFNVINPTGESFSFRWESVPTKENDIPLFHCNTPEGAVTKGKMAESSFTFIPQRHGRFETFYIFTIEKYNLQTTFLLTGVARNPCVFFSASHVVLKATIVNVEVTETITLHNNEDMDFDFQFKKSSLLNNDRTRKITVEPMQGTVEPKSKVSVRIAFKAAQTGQVDFRLKCIVTRMDRPLVLSVLANVFDVEPSVFYYTENARVVLDPRIVNTFELKSLVVGQVDENKFLIKNLGKIGFYYNWKCTGKYNEDYANVEFKDIDGYCPSNTEYCSYVAVKPLRELSEREFKIILEILYGPKYIIGFICTTPKSVYKFSFKEYDFGTCLLQAEKTNYYQTFLEFTNLDQRSLMLEYDWELDNNLSVTFKSKEIAPKFTEKIPIYFHPREAGEHHFAIKFFVNSKIETIDVKGVAITLQIHLQNQEDKFVNLGTVLAGKEVTKTIQIVNKSGAAVHALFDLYDRLPIHTRPKRTLEAEFEKEDEVDVPKDKKKKDKKGDKKKKKDKKSSGGSSKKGTKDSKKKKTTSKLDNKKSKSSKDKSTKSSKSSKTSKKSKQSKDSTSTKSSKKGKKDKSQRMQTPLEHQETAKEKEERLIKESIDITPKKFIKLSSEGTCSLTINFKPKERMVTFTKKVFYQVQDQVEPLCLIKGSCIAADYSLDRDKIPFGNVVKGYSNEVKFTLFNTGDIGGRYKWKFEKNDPTINIEPSEGYISPDMSVTLVAKYQPKTIQCFTSFKAKCTIENYKRPLHIEFTGSCVKAPPPVATVQFVCPVRSTVVKTVTLKNSTSEPWTLKPKICGLHFVPQEEILIPSQSSATCDIKFIPNTMASKEQPHKAVLTVVLPGGNCILYDLEGIADRPLPDDVIERQIYCKTYHNEMLTVRNWSKSPQKFKVVTRNKQPRESKDILFKLTGNAEIDLPGSGERQYKWGIFVMNVGALYFEVLFQNENTKEYLFYEIKLNVQQGGPLEQVNLSTCVRMPCTYKLKLENPLKTEVVFNINSNCEQLHHEKSITIESCTDKIVNIEYVPLFPGTNDVNLEVTTKQLGLFSYHFHLVANDPVPETPVVLKCPLGQNVKRKISVHNYCASTSEFKLKLDNKNIFTPSSEAFHVPPNENGHFEVIFEPNTLGNVQSSLTLSSHSAGQYIYPLIGTCVYPTPQGPIYIKPGSSTSFTFKNPFEETKTFKLTTEPDYFQVKPIIEVLQGKRTMKVTVSMQNIHGDIVNDKPVPYTGKLVVIYADCIVPHLKWTYYLQSDMRK